MEKMYFCLRCKTNTLFRLSNCTFQCSVCRGYVYTAIKEETVTVISTEGDFRVIQRSDTGYYYPQYKGRGILTPADTWAYFYDTWGDRVAEATLDQAWEWK